MIDLSYNMGNHSPRLKSGVSLLDHIRSVASSGFRMVGLDDWSLDQWERDGFDLASLGQVLQMESLRCSDIGPLRVAGESATLEAMARLVHAADVLDASWIPVVVNTDSPRRKAVVCRCAAMAMEAGVELALEFIPWTAVPDLDTARQLVGDVDHPSIRLLLDVFQLARSGSLPADVDVLQPEEIGLIQLSDALPRSGDLAFDSSHRRALPGAGELDLKSLRRVLVEKAWDGVVSLEILSAELRTSDPGQVARAAYQAAEAWLDGGEG